MAVPILKLATIGILPSPIKKMYYKSRGAKIGKNVNLGILSVIDCKNLEIDDGVKMGMMTFICAKNVKLGKRAQIKMMSAVDTGDLEMAEDSIIMEQVTIGGMLTPRSKLYMGKRVRIFPFSFINTTEPVIIEDDSGVGGGSYIFTHGSWLSVLEGYPATFGPVKIEKNVWLPWRVFIMPNVTIGEGSVIGAGSVVTADIPEKSLASGSPAKVILDKGKFLRVPNEEKKFEIVKKIIKEFTEFQDYQGIDSFYQEEGDKVTFGIKYKDRDYQGLLIKEVTEDVGSCNVLISMHSISEPPTAYWFDLENKKAKLPSNYFSKEINSFFSHYGIRFDFID